MNIFKKLTTKKNITLAATIFLGLNLSACGGGSSDGGNTGNGEDTTAPTVSSTSPIDNATDVALNSPITATFNEDIFSTSVDKSSFTLAKSSGESTVGSVSFNGANNIASFTPNDALTKSTAYTATLSTNIADLSGNALVNNYNWSFTTAGRVWGNAEQIEDGDSGLAQAPKIAFDDNGKAIAVWDKHDGNIYSLWARYFNGNNWGNPETIETQNVGHARDAQIAFDNQNNIWWVVWRESDGSRPSIMVNNFNGTNWGTPKKISTSLNSVTVPQIAFNNEGKGLAVWGRNVGPSSNYFLKASHFNGTNWATPVSIEENGHIFNSQIAIDNNGNAIVAWGQRVWEQGVSSQVYVNWVNHFSGGSWGEPKKINDNHSNPGPQIAFDNNGKAMAIWLQKNSENRNNLWAIHFNGTIWGDPKLIDTTSDALSYLSYPNIVFDNNGNALAVWIEKINSTHNKIMVNRFNGTSWGISKQINDNNVSFIDALQIATDNNGNTLVLWAQDDGNRRNSNIWANRFNGSNWGEPKAIENSTYGVGSPQFDFDNNGNALAVWLQRDSNDNLNVWVNHFK